MKKTENQTNWVFLPVSKTRIIKELEKAILIKVDFDRTTILPKVFKRAKETEDTIFFSLPEDFNASIRISVQNQKTRRYEHKDKKVAVADLKACGLDKPLDEEEQEFVGENAEPENLELADENLPF